jgi:pimeloyl-ACP methyl ester carboxylesterase
MALLSSSVQVEGIGTPLVRTSALDLPIVFLHGGVPGITPYCGGLHIWGEVLSDFANDRAVLAYDLPGSGQSGLPAGNLPSIEVLGRHLVSLLDELDVPRCDLVGHAEGGLLALWLAMNASDRVRSISVVASRAAAPTGDIVEDITWASPPSPLWSRVSQAWALDRVSYKHEHIDKGLLDSCVRAAENPQFRALAADMASKGFYSSYMPSVNRTKGQFYALCRGTGVPVPTQIVWASHDPLSPPARGIGLFKDIASRQAATLFSLINRSGSLIFRDQPGEFVDVVSAFHESLAN